MKKIYVNEKIEVNGKVYKYKIYNGRRHSIGIRINAKNEVIVRANKIFPKSWTQDFISKYIEKMSNHAEKNIRNSIVNINKKNIMLEKKQFVLVFEKSNKNSYRFELDKIYIKYKDEKNIRKIIKQIYHDKMEKYIGENKEKIQSYFKQLNIQPTPINHKWLRSKWGYCEIWHRKIYISDLLCAFNTIQIDYVIIHEISHLLVGSHGKKFWNVVAKIIPDYKQIRKELKHGNVILD